ncbi:putative late blight resistance protein homolog R1C-3 [Henckelia pumila]
MAAYASLLSLGHIIDHLLQHLIPRQMAVLDKAQIDSLLENITFLQKFLEDFSLMRRDEIQGLEEKIVSSANAAKDVIESFVAVQILQNSKAKRRWVGIFRCLDFVKLLGKKGTLSNELKSFIPFSQNLQKVIEEISSLKKDVMKIKETEGIKIMEQPRKAATAGSFILGASHSKNTMVGFDEDLIQIMETLTGDESNLHILSIVGMGGIGKTTLAKNVFDNPLIVQHFDRRAWVTISQQYSVHEILLGLLEYIGVLVGGGEEITQDELGLRLHKSLFDRRYFIVMDDMWSIEVWDATKRFFPENNNGSRVMVTTRLTNVADDFRSCAPHQLRLLDEDQSWALFCDKVFGPESCPPELEEVGKTIVRNCGALPLAIVVISGLLAKCNRTVEYWEYVANDTYKALNMGGDGLCFEILYLSYKHLPVHLKPCFLYMATFPEDSKIRITRLVKLWVAEGILKPIRSRSLEEIAEENLKDLIDRNLIMIHYYGFSNKMKTCTIHDLLRDLSIREALKENFLGVTMKGSRISRLITQRSSEEEKIKSSFAKLHILREVLKMGYVCSDEEIVRLVNFRYIDFRLTMLKNLLNTLESVSLLWNLQTITIAGGAWSLKQPTINLPAEIWEMPQLRHIKRDEGVFHLPDPPSTNIKNGRGDIIVLKNLQTLHNIRNFRCTDEVVDRIPNLKKLGITYNRRFRNCFGWDHYKVCNLARLCNLESLFLEGNEKNVLQNVCFPPSLKKLTLQRGGLCWEDLTAVGSLPHLEVLTLMDGAFKGREWNPVEGQFLELKCLRINDTDVEEWTADSSHFPRLEKLILACLYHLKEIPQGIVEIPTLRSISVVLCNESLNSSATKIQEDQQNLGNSDLLVGVA